MSAWVVSKTHIDLLVRAALAYGRRPSVGGMQWWQVDAGGEYAGWRKLDEFAESVDPNGEQGLISPSQLGQMLVSENIASVSHRYPNDDVDAGELPGPCDAYYMGPYVYENPGYTLTPGEVFKAIDYYDYQSCEHPEWRQSETFAFLVALRERVCAEVDGYDAAPWGWEASNLEGRSLEFSRRVI